MNKLTSIFLLCCPMLSGAQFNPTPIVTLHWSYPTNELSTNLLFRVWHSTSVAAPRPWQNITNVVGTNLQVTINVQTCGFHAFYLSASNFWGDSDPSEVATTPPLPVATNRLWITYGGN